LPVNRKLAAIKQQPVFQAGMSLLGDLRGCGSYCSWLLDEQIGDIESLPASACARFSTN
jgi:hypothetical protein